MKIGLRPFVYSSIIIASILTIVFLVAFGVVKTEDVRSSLIDAEICKTFSFTGGQYNLLFFADAETTKRYADYLLNFPPLNEKKEEFNIYYNDKYDENCENYKGIALLCYSKARIKEASKCPSDYIVVVKEAPSDIRSSSYVNVMSINSENPLTVVAHEFGHAFANLAEEYVQDGARLSSKQKNCVQECTDFDVSDGCFEGCTYSSYKRSVNEGVMRTLFGQSFGKFNENLIKNRIPSASSSITGSAIAEEETNCAEKNYYLIEAVYNSQQEQIAVLDTSFEQGCSGNGYGDFDYALYVGRGNVLHR